MNRHSAYVALSRARDKTELFIDRKSIDSGMKQELPLDQRRDFKPDDDQDRLAFLGKALGQDGLKRTTLDFKPAVAHDVQLPLTPQSNPTKRKTLSLD